jgi:outer membrane protein TolC
MKTLHKLTALLVLLYPLQLAAQPLESLLVQADSANLELRALYLEYQAALEKAPQVSQLPDPEAGLGLFVLPVETRLGPQWVRLSATQVFPWKGALKARKDLVLVMAEAQYQKVEATRLNLHYQVRKAWYEYYELEQRQAILAERLGLYESLEALATTRVAAGKADLSDVLRIQLRIREIETEILQLRIRQRKPLATINQLLARPEGSPLAIHDTLPLADFPYDPPSLLDSIGESHPLLRIYALQQEAARQSIEVNRLEGMPSFAVGLDYIAVGKRADADPLHNGRDILGPRVGVRVPLYRDKYKAREQEERLRIEALEVRRTDQLLQFRAAIMQAFTDVQDAQLQYELARQQRETLISVWNLLLQAYETSGAGFTDLLQVDDQRIRYELLELAAIVQSHRGLNEVERYIP